MLLACRVAVTAALVDGALLLFARLARISFLEASHGQRSLLAVELLSPAGSRNSLSQPVEFSQRRGAPARSSPSSTPMARSAGALLPQLLCARRPCSSPRPGRTCSPLARPFCLPSAPALLSVSRALCAPAPCTLTQLDLPCRVAHTSARPCSLLRPSPARWPRPRRGFSHGRLTAQPKPRSCTKQQASDSSTPRASTRFATLCRRSVQPRCRPQLDLVAWIRRRVSLSGGRAHPARLLSSTVDVGHPGLFTNSAAGCRVSSTSVPAPYSSIAASCARIFFALALILNRVVDLVVCRRVVEPVIPCSTPTPARSKHDLVIVS